MLTPREEKCWLCGAWAICEWSMGPVRRWCLLCVAEYDAFMAAHS